MNYWNVVDDNELARIHEATMKVLAEEGVAILWPEAVEIFRRHGAKVDGKKVYIPSGLVEESLAAAPASFTLSARNPAQDLTIGLGQAPLYAPTVGVVFVLEPDYRRRPATVADQENFLRFSQLSDVCALSCGGLVYPQELQGRSGLLTQMYNALVLSDKPVLGLSQDGEIARRSLAMAALARGDSSGLYTLAIINSFSPLAWDEKMLQALVAYAEKGQPIVVTCCSLMGLSSPLGIGETVVCNNAELLAGITLAQLVNPGTPVVYGNTSTAVEMRQMNCTLGAPEYALISALSGQLARYYCLPYRSGGGLSDAKAVDAQAGVESALNLKQARDAGVNLMFHALGAMDSFLSISYEKWLLDEETIGRIDRLYNGAPPLQEDLLASIGQVGAMGNYLDHETTFANYNSLLYTPPLANRDNYEVWRAKGETFLAHTSQKVSERLAAYEQPYLEKSVAKQLRSFLTD